MHGLFAWTMNTLGSGGYLGVILLMALESSIVPIPSELIIPPAAYWATQGKMTMAGVILAGTFGSWLGAAISYQVSRLVGRPLIAKWGRYVLVSEQKLAMGEAWVQSYGTFGIFISRLLPVVRHLISIPAGICAMDFTRFSLMTVLGAGLWCSVLAWMGANVITPGMLDNSEGLMAALKAKEHWIVIVVVIIGVLYGVMLWMAARAGRKK